MRNAIEIGKTTTLKLRVSMESRMNRNRLLLRVDLVSIKHEI